MPQIQARPDSEEWPKAATEYLERFRAAYRKKRGHDLGAGLSTGQLEDTAAEGQRIKGYTLEDDMILLEWILRPDRLINRKYDYRGLVRKVRIIRPHLREHELLMVLSISIRSIQCNHGASASGSITCHESTHIQVQTSGPRRRQNSWSASESCIGRYGGMTL